ncbi:MAG: Fic family protein [Eggerthellaceae bacterium]
MTVSYHHGCFPPKHINWEQIALPLAKASDALARYDSFLSIIPNPNILIAPMMVQEAVTSSRIEGTHATVGDVLIYEAGKTDVDLNKKNDIIEVLNYQRAVKHAESMLRSLPLSGRVLRETHAVLLEGVRGQYKSPGEYRADQNWIGRSNVISEARYIPIEPDAIGDAMHAWEAYVNEGDHPALVKVAIAHAELESIHPFLDGNGRIGRIVVPLMLCDSGLISHPCFYLSEFFEHRNVEYQDRLLAVSKNDDWTQWCAFFLSAIETQATDNNEKAKRIFKLYEKVRSELADKSNSGSAGKAVDTLFRSAIFPANVFTSIAGVGPKTGRRLLNLLKEMGIVKELVPHSGTSPAIMMFEELLEITEGARFDFV